MLNGFRRKKRIWRVIFIALAVVLAIAAAIGLYYVPPIHAKLAWRLEDLQTKIYYLFNPPGEVVFLPTQQNQMTIAPRVTATITPTPQANTITTPTITPTAIPQQVQLSGITFVDQMHRYNFCGPANLAMALNYVGWKGSRDDVGAAIKPGVDDPKLDAIQRSQTDVNVMPYEMVDFVNDETPYKALYRYGGTTDLLKRLIAAGFPVITEKGIYQDLPPEYTLQWAGHYAFTTGYDDNAQQFIWQDSYTPNENIDYEKQGKNVRMSYAEYVQSWRAFNYVFIVVYKPEQEVELYRVLGNWAYDSWANQHALDIANQETTSLTGLDQFFAWFNKGTSEGLLTEYGQAALAYDQAFSLYGALPAKDRPYRIMWYQTGAYRAYFYTSRFQDLITLANQTEKTLWKDRVLEETLYWRALAKVNVGIYDSAYEDMRKAVHYHPGFQPALDMLTQWGIAP